jgi:hypothetical protein
MRHTAAQSIDIRANGEPVASGKRKAFVSLEPASSDACAQGCAETSYIQIWIIDLQVNNIAPGVNRHGLRFPKAFHSYMKARDNFTRLQIDDGNGRRR